MSLFCCCSLIEARSVFKVHQSPGSICDQPFAWLSPFEGRPYAFHLLMITLPQLLCLKAFILMTPDSSLSKPSSWSAFESTVPPCFTSQLLLIQINHNHRNWEQMGTNLIVAWAVMWLDYAWSVRLSKLDIFYCCDFNFILSLDFGINCSIADEHK